MKAVLHYRSSPGFRDLLARRTPDWLDIVVVEEADTGTFAAAMGDTEVLFHVLQPVTAAVIRAAPCLRLIQKIGVGVNTIDLAAAQQRGIAVANMPGTNTQAVVEMTLLLMLAVLRRITAFDTATRQGRGWQTELTSLDAVGEIAGRTVGLVGYGAVASRLAEVLKALGATLLYTARQPKAKAGAAAKWCSLSELLQQSDIVSLHLPLTAHSANLMNAKTFGLMKPGSIFINTARGGLVDSRPPYSMPYARAGCGRLGSTCLPPSRWKPTIHSWPLSRLLSPPILPGSLLRLWSAVLPSALRTAAVCATENRCYTASCK